MHDSKVEENIFKILKEKSMDFEVIEHKAVYTCDVAAKLANHDINEGIKSIFLKIYPSKEFVLYCLPGGKRIDGKYVLKSIGSRKMRFASADEVYPNRRALIHIWPGRSPAVLKAVSAQYRTHVLPVHSLLRCNDANLVLFGKWYQVSGIRYQV